MKAFLKAALGDGENPSASRLIAVPCAMALVLLPLFTWAVLSWRAGAMLEIPGSVTGFVSACLIPILGFLNIQKREETKTP